MSTEIRTISGVYEVKETVDQVFHSEEEKGYYKVSEYGEKFVPGTEYYKGFFDTDYEKTQTVYINKRNVISIKKK